MAGVQVGPGVPSFPCADCASRHVFENQTVSFPLAESVDKEWLERLVRGAA